MSKDNITKGAGSNTAVGKNATDPEYASLTVCIVTPDLLGPVKNGGIGTACTYLAHELASAGHRISILFAQPQTSATNTDTWITEYQAKNIHVTVLENEQNESITRTFPDHSSLQCSIRVYEWLANREGTEPFDVVIFMEWQGAGFYALHAKKCGLLFQNTVFVVQIHSPSLWHSVNNADLQGGFGQSITWYIERRCIEMADAVTSPSAYMLDWCSEQGYKIPSENCVLRNFLPVKAPHPSGAENKEISELVFFGRLEYRKGIVQFCDAVEVLLKEGFSDFSVTFLGKPAWVGNEHAGLYIGRRTRHWPIAVSILSTFDHYQALEYLSEDGRLAVMPSVADNSPYTVYECLKAHIPFIARNVGGVPELIASKAHATCLCADTPHSLAEKIRAALTLGISSPSLAFSDENNRDDWMKFLRRVAAKAKTGTTMRGLCFGKNARPLVSLCLTHYSRPKLLIHAIQSLIAQDYPNFEVILVDDGSPDEPSRQCLQQLDSEFAKRGWKILYLKNGYPGKARNEAARVARGEWLLFFDDDNVAMPHMLRRFVHAALHSQSRLVTSSFNIFSGEGCPTACTKITEKFLPLGNIVSWSTVNNAIGDTTSLIHRSLFKQLGGFTEDYGLGHEDFELLLKAVLSGECVEIIPEPLFWYRNSANSIQRSTNTAANRLRSIRPFLQMLPPEIAETALLSHALAVQKTTLHERKSVAPSQLDEESQASFALRSPESCETLCAVADSLMRDSQPVLARQLLEAVSNSTENTLSDVTASIYSVKACFEISNNRYDQVLHYATEFEAKTDNDKSRARFYITVLKALHAASSESNKDIILNLCKRFEPLSELSYQELLGASECCFEAKAFKQASKLFRMALQNTEDAYFSMRPDVKQAVLQGQFTCALHHFVLYGKSENITWPNAKAFSLLTPYFIQYAENLNCLSVPPVSYIQEAFLHGNAN